MQWRQHTNKTLESLKTFTSQIQLAAREGKPTVILGDANFCSEKWEE